MAEPAAAEPHVVVLPTKLQQECEQDDPQWIVLKLDSRLRDWENMLKKATLRLRSGRAQLDAPSATERLQAVWDTSSSGERRHLLPFKPKTGTNQLKPVSEVSTLVRVVRAVEPGNLNGSDALAADREADAGRALKLRPVVLGDTESPPFLGFWRGGGPAGACGAFENLKVKCFQTPRKSGQPLFELTGKFADAPLMRLVGRPIESGGGAAPGWRYLVGVAEGGVGKLHLYEARVFVIERFSGTFSHIDGTNDASKASVDYSEQRLGAIQSFGAAKKRRLKEGEKARQVKESQVEDALDETTLDGMRQKRDQHANANKSTKDEELHLISEILPPFDLEAKLPADIYKNGLDKIAEESSLHPATAAKNEEGIENVFAASGDNLKELIKKPPAELLRSDILSECGNPMVAAVVRARAEGAMLAPKDPADAVVFVRKLAVLHCLMDLYSQRKRRTRTYRRNDMQKIMSNVPAFFQDAWFEYFFEGVQSKADRVLCADKVLCHAIIWALYLTPKFKLDLVGALGAIDLNELERNLRTTGCSVQKVRSKTSQHIERMEASLKAPLALPEPKFGGGPRKKQKKG